MQAGYLTLYATEWPAPDVVLAALRKWADLQANVRPDLTALGFFGSHARGDSGFGSDLDLVAIVERSEHPRMERNRDWPYELLPVPVDLLVFTIKEWTRIHERGGGFARIMEEEVVWIVGAPHFPSTGGCPTSRP